MSDAVQHLRMLEALLFAAGEPLDMKAIAARLPDDADIEGLLAQLAEAYASRGVNLLQVGGKWQLRTAPDLRFLLQEERQEVRKLSRAALETLAIIAYHQPVTRAEIEEIRGVAISKGTLDQLLELGWAKLRGRRRTPGRPTTYGTTDEFLAHFGLPSIGDLPGIEELKATGLLNAVPHNALPMHPAAGEEELPLEDLPPEDRSGEDGAEEDVAADDAAADDDAAQTLSPTKDAALDAGSAEPITAPVQSEPKNGTAPVNPAIKHMNGRAATPAQKEETKSLIFAQ